MIAVVQALYVEAKVEASKTLSEHIEQLNTSLEHKRVTIENNRRG